MNKFICVLVLLSAHFNLRAEIPDIIVEEIATYVYQDQNEERSDVGYFGFVVKITSTEEDIYIPSIFTGPNGAGWTVVSSSGYELAGNKSAALTTIDAPVYGDYFEVRAGHTETFIFDLSFESEDSDAVVKAVLVDLKYSTEPNGAITVLQLNNLNTNSVFLDGNPVVPEPHSFTLLMIGLAGLRMVTKRK